MTPDQFRALGYRVVDWIARFMQDAENLPVQSRARPGEIAAALPSRPPEHGISLPDGCAPLDAVPAAWNPVFDDLDRIILPGLTHWQSPNFFAYFPCNGSAPGILGEFLSAGLNVNGMLWATSPAATELETRMLDWMRDALGLPDRFGSTSPNGGGCIQGTASESTLIAMVAARDRARRAGAPDGNLVAYASEQAHSSVVKAAMIAGLADGPGDRRRLRLIATDAAGAMRADRLTQALADDRRAGLRPFYLCATLGTTGTTAFDPLDLVAPLAREHDLWLHVDAAHAGSACICPELRSMLRGVEAADSFCVNPHKWLLTNFDCDLFWTADRRGLISSLSVTPEYLRNAASESGNVFDYRDWQAPLGRRFRALKLWLVIRHYGLEGLRAHVREHVRLAARLEEWVRADERFEVSAPRTLNLVCFRLRGEGSESDDRNRALLDRVNATGRAFLSHGVVPTPSADATPSAAAGRFMLRLCVGSTPTREEHVRAAWGLIRQCAADLR